MWATAEHASNNRVGCRYIVGAGTDVYAVADGGYQWGYFCLGNISSNKAVTVFIYTDDMVADFVVAGNGAAGYGVFKPAQKAMDVVDFYLGLSYDADVDISGAFNAPYNDASFRIAKAGYAFGQILAVVTREKGNVFAYSRSGLFEV